VLGVEGFAKPGLGAVQENTGRIRSDLQLLGNLPIAHFTEIPEAKYLSFFWRQLGHRCSQAGGEFASLRAVSRPAIAGPYWRRVASTCLTTFLAGPLAQSVDSACGCQAL
jgi:hypothetical protein